MRVKRATTFKDNQIVEYFWLGTGPIGDESPVCTGIKDEKTAKLLASAPILLVELEKMLNASLDSRENVRLSVNDLIRVKELVKGLV